MRRGHASIVPLDPQLQTVGAQPRAASRPTRFLVAGNPDRTQHVSAVHGALRGFSVRSFCGNPSVVLAVKPRTSRLEHQRARQANRRCATSFSKLPAHPRLNAQTRSCDTCACLSQGSVASSTRTAMPASPAGNRVARTMRIHSSLHRSKRPTRNIAADPASGDSGCGRKAIQARHERGGVAST